MKEGDYVLIKTKEGERQGLVVPSTDSSLLILKLSSGYNIVLNKKEIISSKVLKQPEKKKEASIKLTKNPKLKNITILHTGGTIASKVDYKTGGVSTRFAPEDLISMFPEIKDIVNVETRLVRNMWSEDLRFSHYNLLAKEVEKEVKNGKDVVIITHGTDTLAFTSSALAFILEDINIPVILVGAQRSSDRGSSDASFNLIQACKFISETDFVGVSVCMHETSEDKSCLIFPSCKIKKLHSSRRDAFKVINGNPIARISNQIEFLSKHTKKAERKLKLKLINEKIKVGI